MMNENLTLKETTKNHFDETAEEYDKSYDGMFVKCMYNEILDRVIKLNPKKILDLGCGNGNILKLLSQKTDAELCGLDLSEKMICQAEKRLAGKAEFTIGDAENLPYKTNEFDVVICNASFHHYTNPVKVLKEVKRILKSHGVLILGDPTSPFDWYLKILNYFLKYSTSGDYKIYSSKEIIQLLTSCGFNIEDFKKINYRTFALNAVSNQ